MVRRKLKYKWKERADHFQWLDIMRSHAKNIRMQLKKHEEFFGKGGYGQWTEKQIKNMENGKEKA